MSFRILRRKKKGLQAFKSRVKFPPEKYEANIETSMVEMKPYQLVWSLVIYMKKFLHSDWLRAVQFFFKQCRKELIQCKKRKQTKHSDWSMIKETDRWPIKSFAFKSNARPGWRNFSLIA